MSDSIEDILAKRQLKLPVDAALVRDYIKDKLSLVVSVQSNPRSVTIQVQGSAAAGHLRPYLHIISRDCGITDKRLSIRIE